MFKYVLFVENVEITLPFTLWANGKWRGTGFPRHDHPFDRFLLEFSACLFIKEIEEQTGEKRLAAKTCKVGIFR